MTAPAASNESSFPIRWDDPSDAERPWFQDVMHFPLPQTPLNATLFQPAFAEGSSRAIAKLSMPITGLDTQVHNGYLFLGPRMFTGTPAEVDARMAEMQQRIVELCPTLLRDWRETFEPEVLRRIDRILGHDYAAGSIAEQAEFMVGLRSDLVDIWDIHMRVNIPVMGSVFGLEDMLTGILGPDVLGKARLMLQGFENRSTETGRAFWELSRWVRTDPGLQAAVLAARVRQGQTELDPTPARDEFLRRWGEFLDKYGWRSDQFGELGCKTWREDPSTPLTQLKAYAEQDDSADPFNIVKEHQSTREVVTREIEARLPEPARPQFEGLLMMAQQFLPISEDHNFTIDQHFTAAMRYAALHLGERLQAEGLLRDAEDVFYLQFAEIERIADGGAGTSLDGVVQQRRRERGRQATMRPPLLIGTPPPADMPPDPLVTKFFGVGHIPSEDTSVVTGHPCSRGVVTGTAKIVPTLDDAAKLEPGDILVCRMTMPAWTPLFGVAGGIVADSGGPLSHCAIV
ncbi:MAG TPA: PEP-utilizing enzyme, partial [Tepidiformaceae bacterium]|nr:PEP-utilizing enzyme [Tepidiformaceae bacterium]